MTLKIMVKNKNIILNIMQEKGLKKIVIKSSDVTHRLHISLYIT